MKTKYVVGFAFINKEVLLIKKIHPEWQKGKLNGVGGKINENEKPHEAMRREFYEEAGVDFPDWNFYAKIETLIAEVYFFYASSDKFINCFSRTNEELSWHSVSFLQYTNVLNNLKWLVPLAYFGFLNKNLYKELSYDPVQFYGI